MDKNQKFKTILGLIFLFFIGTILITISLKLLSYNVEFTKEEIYIEIDTNISKTKGIYYFSNRSYKKKIVPIRYPFASESYTLNFITINQKEINYSKKKDAIFFEIEFDPFESKILEIEYLEPFEQKYTYILTTTQSWSKPIQKATFNLHIKFDYDTLESNYDFNETESSIYKYEVKKFMPNENLEIILKNNIP